MTDTTPSQFSFIDQVDVALSTPVNANNLVITGINATTPISVSGGQYAVNGGSFTASPGTVNNNDAVQVRQTSSASYATASHATLTIGGVSDTFTVTTLAEDTTSVIDSTPDAFNFLDQVDVAVNTDVISNIITVTGINTAAVISVSGGLYAVNDSVFTSDIGAVNEG
ncbi:MAG: hypothetical protein RQ733_12380, partial [Methyloprofundus sp.]|nr:hypothetical protein [Methyloprofundus sp.]